MSDKIEWALDSIKQNLVVSDAVNQGMSRDEQLGFARQLLQGSSSVKDQRCGEFTKQFGNLEISFDTDRGEKVVTDIVNKTSGKDLYDTPEQLYRARSESSASNQRDALVGIDDKSTMDLCKATTPEEKKIASKVLEDLLNGKDVSAELNSSPTSSRGILAVVKQDLLQLSEGAGGKVGTENTEGLATDFERSRFIDFTTVKGERVAIEESQFGVIKDMKVNSAVLPFNLIPSFKSTNDVYDRPGEAELRAQQEKAEHPNRGLLEIMAGKPLDGNIIIEKAADRSRDDVKAMENKCYES